MSRFPLSLNTSTIRPIPLLEKISIAGLIGFDAVELWIDDLEEHIRREGSLKDIRSALHDFGLEVASVIALFGWTGGPNVMSGRILGECCRRMDLATEVGSRTIIASPPQELVDSQHAGDRYRQLCELGRARGLPVSVEFLGFVEGIKTLKAAKAIVEQSGESSGTLVADVYHLLRGGGSLDDILECEGRDISVFHINDLPAYPPILEQEDSDRVMLGDGVVDLNRVVANLSRIGYSGPISLELFNPHLWMQDPLDVCRIGMERLRALISS